jgi:hypothetical protein
VGSVTAERLIVLAEMFGCRSDQLVLGASEREDDQAGAIALLLKGLNADDRRFVLDTGSGSPISGARTRRPIANDIAGRGLVYRF